MEWKTFFIGFSLGILIFTVVYLFGGYFFEETTFTFLDSKNILSGGLFRAEIPITNTAVDCDNPLIKDNEISFQTTDGTFNYTNRQLCWITKYREYANTMMIIMPFDRRENVNCFVGNLTYLQASALSRDFIDKKTMEKEACDSMQCMEVYANAFAD